ncbi:MAG: SH3 domain-containing protein [Clostridia bacterium]|nr:SH3 domain-containing protein [Clostridia bacterium]
MKKNYLISFAAAALLVISMTVNVCAAGIAYFPDVTGEMSDYTYWTQEKEQLMTIEEIQALNARTIAVSATCMYDLKNLAGTVDGISLNEALKTSTQADASYYLGWTYVGGSDKATQEDFDVFVANTQNPNAHKDQSVLYGIAVKRTELRTFPSTTPIWDNPNDKDFDYQYLTSIRVNEPLVITSVSADGNFYLAKSISCSGWVPVQDVAICKDKSEWLSAWDIPSDNVVVVYGDKVYTEMSLMGTQTSELMLTMGTVLEKYCPESPNNLIDNRSTYNNYVVWVPVRNADGSYSKKLTLISEHNKVSEGFLPLTQQNIAMVAFSALGNTYGWGGSMHSDDCSGYMRNVYKCFGIELARNTSWQSQMPMAKVDMSYMCREEREKLMDALPLGSLLYFSGHEMMYLGNENGKYYVISAISSVMQPENASVRQRVRSVVLNTLDVKRANGNSWLDDLNLALVPYWSADDNNLPGYEWYHDGVAFCLKNKMMQGDENKYFHPGSNITWAQLLQILWNTENVSDNGEAASEASEGMWYDKAVTWAREKNLIYENDADFQPDSHMTREQLAAVMYLYARYKGYDVSGGTSTDALPYADAQDISDYAAEAVRYMTKGGFMNGKTESTFDPVDNTTRAETATILKRFTEANK